MRQDSNARVEASYLRQKALVKAWGTDAPRCQVAHGKFGIGEYQQAFAVLAWVEQRQQGWPIVGARLSLMDQELTKVVGGLNMGLPLTPKTERHVCVFLEDLGWDGRVWPHKDHGWPESTEEESGLLGLLKTSKLGATLTFPPQEQGTPTVGVPVLHPKNTYLCVPFNDGPVIPRYLDTLRTLAANPTPFVSDWS